MDNFIGYISKCLKLMGPSLATLRLAWLAALMRKGARVEAQRQRGWREKRTAGVQRSTEQQQMLTRPDRTEVKRRTWGL